MSLSTSWFSGIGALLDRTRIALPSSLPIYFTADWHLGHVTERLQRGIGTDEWGAKIKESVALLPEDAILFMLGDMTCVSDPSRERLEALIYPILDHLKHVLFIPGNHDDRDFWKYDNFRNLIRLPPIVDLHLEDLHIVLSHYPIRNWNRCHHGSWHFHGHTHGGLQDDYGAVMGESVVGRELLTLDVGVDCHNYQFVSLDKAKILMAGKTPKLERHWSLPRTL